MNRTGLVQQQLIDSLPVEVCPEEEKEAEELSNLLEPLSLLEPIKVENTDEIKKHKQNEYQYSNLEDSNIQNEWKKKSIESDLPSTSNQMNVKVKLQTDSSKQSEECSLKPKDYSFQERIVRYLLDARQVDAETELLDFGFGPSRKQQKMHRIPDRFLGPSKVNGISTEKYIQDEQHSTRLNDCAVMGYRDLTGNPHAPPSKMVAKIMDTLLEADDRLEQNIVRTSFPVPVPRSNVLDTALHKFFNNQ